MVPELVLAESARSLIEEIRSSGPSRRVGGGRSNVVAGTRAEDGRHHQFESHRVELAGIYEMEHDIQSRVF